jgi:light-regulated signal transduction histidine kinase (bacteriophytochrome)
VLSDADNIADSQVIPRYYRVIRKDGELRYFRSAGKFIPDNDSNNTHIGIIKDITQMQMSNRELEERNIELEQSINELESFNRVASHDLQEPLRKIQTFISRISEKESLTMSDTGKDYFQKILLSVNRMRVLIDDLLLFSRTTKIEKAFEPTDLNYILENAIQELSPDIEEEKAIIKSDKLPILNVIPFQIQQLFTNLISNSLKYSRNGVAPDIMIKCETVIAKEYTILKSTNHIVYFKISISDNGMGFEQQYAESIFMLFHRLHHKAEFPGSGIGLSICKKIVENHSGYIVAEGKPGVGAVFTIFLPK